MGGGTNLSTSIVYLTRYQLARVASVAKLSEWQWGESGKKHDAGSQGSELIGSAARGRGSTSQRAAAVPAARGPGRVPAYSAGTLLEAVRPPRPFLATPT